MRAGVERIVYTSQVATFDLRAGGLPTRPCRCRGTAGDRRLQAQQDRRRAAGRRAWSRAGLPAVIVNPSTPIGPRDVKPTPTGRIIIEAAAGRMPAFIETGLNFVHVDDVAAGHLAALERGRIGERYILGGENVTLRQMLLDIAAHRRSGGRAAAAPAARRDLSVRLRRRDAGARHRARAVRHGRWAAHGALHRCIFDDAKARRELGYTSRPYREGLGEAIEWFIQAGYMKRPRAI